MTLEYTKNNFYAEAARKLQMNADEMTTFMWNTYHPGNIWYIIAGIGLLTIIGLFIYNSIINKGNQKVQTS
ncbi:hypothetical protein MNBD_BACTEROID04-1600 [hydrothermal vent metagenome]|uniref:Uncharacterized protein n=1 Tax=hydrothermal vent metagenome TaxID=652676 RepID=A0A3B0V236_9ZZZZ